MTVTKTTVIETSPPPHWIHVPVSSGPQLNLPKTIAFAVASLAAGIGLLLLIVWLTGSGDLQLKIGDDLLEVGAAERFADIIEEDQQPFLLASLSRDRPVFLQHLGEDPLAGWSAFDARSPSDPEGCETGLIWEIGNQIFRDTCSPSDTYAPDGAGLLQYTTRLDLDGTLFVDLNQDEEPTPSS